MNRETLPDDVAGALGWHPADPHYPAVIDALCDALDGLEIRLAIGPGAGRGGPLYSQVAGDLRQTLAEGTHHGGLPPLRVLAGQYRCSTGTMGRAVRSL